MTSHVGEYDCTRKCRHRPHANSIIAALTKRGIADDKLAAYISKTCSNYADIVDDLGRSAVHLSASVGRYAVLEWLLNQGAFINARDFESGSSPLHRAIFYGCIDCAVLLLRYGASLDLLDEDTRNPLQNVCRMNEFSQYAEIGSSNELLVWGSNKNYNLGLGNEEGSEQPTSVEFFRKQHIFIESVALGAYHSLFLDKKSILYAVGHGKGGRLGFNTENTLTAPKKVKVPIKNTGEYIIDMSVSRKHSLLLTNLSTVFACGLNEDQQLGVRDAGEKLSTFKEVVTLRDFGVSGMMHVIALDHYSLVYSEDLIYAWGANNGQFGIEPSLKNVKTVPVPKLLKLPPRTAINFVEANNSAIVVVTKDNSILLMYNGKMKALKPPNFEGIKSIRVVGGDADKASKGTATALKLLILTSTNGVYFWYEMKQNFFRCIFSNIHLAQIDKIFYKGNQVLILSDGDVYRGKCNQIPVPAYIAEAEAAAAANKGVGSFGEIWNRCDQNRTEISKEYMIRIDLQRVSNVDRAIDIFCDADFTSFAVLQESNGKYFKLPTLTAEEYSFKKLYNDVNVYDAIHDVVFHVEGETFPAHKLMIYARSTGLCEILKEQTDKHVHLNFPRLTGKMFELMLKYIYTNNFPNEDDLDDIHQSLGPESPGDSVAICQLFLMYAEKFKLHNLANFLRSFLEQESFYLPNRADKSKYRFNRLHPTDFPMLHDVRIICAGDVEIPAHKCILVARLEYFDMMFTHTWAEKTVINLSTIPVEYMQPILDFLYTADVEQFRKQNYSQTFLYNMIVFCDQFFIDRLRKVCEISILDKITIRKCGEMLDFAVMYNCEVLKRGCMDFICQNLARVLSHRCLEDCDGEALACLNSHYRNLFKDVFDYRMITPDSEAIEDELLLSFVDGFSVDLNVQLNEQEETIQRNALRQKSQETKTKQAKRQYEREAISSMMESMQLNEQNEQKERHNSTSTAIKDAQVVAEKLQAEAKSWMKVVDKKDAKKRQTIEHTVHVNEVLKAEVKSKPDMISLNTTDSVRNEVAVKPVKAPEKDAIITETDSTPTKAFNISLADFTPAREKLSQKQRKRLISETSNAGGATPIASTSTTKPIATPKSPPQPNAWGVLPQSPTEASMAFSPSSPATGSSADPTSFANMMRGAAMATSPSTSNAENSFSKILADERKQREYFDRMRNKSLVLTQIEETAIAELRTFYNVDNVTDEIITIERKPRPVTMNFAVWQRN